MAVNNKLKLVSHTIPNSAAPGYSHILESIELDDPTFKKEFDKHSDVQTMYDVFWRSAKKYAKKRFLGCRPFNRATNMFENYVFITYEQAAAIVNDLASGIIHVLSLHFDLSSPTHKKLIENRNFGVGIYADNRMEWALAERASITQSLFSVALYDTLGASSVEYIINHSELPIIFCSLSKIPKILEMVDRLPTLKVIVSMDNFSNFEGSVVSTNKNDEDEVGHVISGFSPDSIEILKQWAASKSIGLYDFKELRKVGKSNPRPHVPPKPEDSYTLCYTSGTTANPKGVISSHYSYACSTVYGNNFFPENENDTPILLSYLPLAHCYGRLLENVITVLGGIIGYYCGDVSKILEDCQLLKPTLFGGVPRVLNKFYAGLAATTIDSPDSQVRQISRIAVEEKIKNLKDGKGLVHKVWDEKIFNKTKAILGGNVRRIYSGSAPLEPYVSDFLKVVLITEILEGYGLTETASVVTGQMAGVVTSGDIGSPKPKMQARLRDAPEMEYLTTDKPCPRGELLIRGPLVFDGYLKDEKNTKEALIGDGWLATGDIARFNPDGSISIIDRKKNIFKLSQGEYVAPENLENILMKHNLVAQAFVHGYSTKNCLVGVIVPDPETFVSWAQGVVSSAGRPEKNMSYVELTKNKAVNAALLKELEVHFTKSKTQRFEILKAIHVECTPFDVTTNKLMTPTFKLKRFDAAKYYKDIIDVLYEQV